MIFFGLHIADIAVILVYLGLMIFIGQRTRHGVKAQTDLYLGGRKLGRWMQFFLNFGNMTELNGAVSTTSVVYRSGVAGVWLNLQTLFMTPYYWFMYVWFRRVRLVTVAELFEDRFGSRSIATFYSAFNIIFATAMIGGGYLISFKAIAPLVIKPPAVYSPVERQQVADYAELSELRTSARKGLLDTVHQQRFDQLKRRAALGEISSYVSYLRPVPFYLAYTVVVIFYVVSGGLKAAVITDIIQGLLIMLFSVMLIPVGLMKVGGFHGLHEILPAYFFDLFGSASTGEYNTWSLLAILFASLVQIHAAHGNMSIGGSAKDETAARLGGVTGGFAKRLMIIAWSLCGLVAAALLGRNLSDADNTWGVLSQTLLASGLLGLMLVGMLAAKMSALSAQSLAVAALFARNLYRPMFPGKTDQHYLFVGRLTIVAVLLGGIALAMVMDSVVALTKMLISAGAVFGAPIMLAFLWRRLTSAAVHVTLVVGLLVIAVLPYVLSAIPAVSTAPALCVETEPRVAAHQLKATVDDIQSGAATSLGQLITKSQRIESVGVYFESVIPMDPHDPRSKRMGLGRFHTEIYFLHLFGVDPSLMTPAGLLAARFWFDGLFPIMLAIVFSYFTKQTSRERVLRFYAKMKTPIGATPEADAEAVQMSFADPTRFDDKKMFPRTAWEFTKWDRTDAVGFAGYCAVAAAILWFFELLLGIGS